MKGQNERASQSTDRDRDGPVGRTNGYITYKWYKHRNGMGRTRKNKKKIIVEKKKKKKKIFGEELEEEYARKDDLKGEHN